MRAQRASKPPAIALGLALALVLLLTACAGFGSTPHAAVHSHDLGLTVSAAELTDTSGHPYSLATDPGKPVTLVFFGYTHCPDICQLVMANLASAMKRLDSADRDRVDVVFVTTDPDRDTGPVLRRYLDHLDPAFIGLTGDIRTIAAVGKSVGVGMGQPLPSGGYDLDAHSTQVTEITPQGRASRFWPQDTTSAQYAHDLHLLLEHSG